MKNKPDFVRQLIFALLVLVSMLPSALQAAPVEQASLPGRHFREERLTEYKQESEFRYEVNPYREITIGQKIRNYLYRLLRAIFRQKGVTPLLTSAIFLGLIVFAVIRFSGGQFRWIFGKGSKHLPGQVSLPDEEIGGIDLNGLADKALQEGDLRLCIRYHYLYILKELNEAAFISWHKDKTNRDYLHEIQSADIRSQFQIQTLIFDYVWYGKFQPRNDQFQKIQSGFGNLIKAIRQAKEKPYETSMIAPSTNRNENPGYANWSEAEIPEGNSIRPLKNKLFTDES